MRYVGQEHAVTVDLPRDLIDEQATAPAIKAEFDAVHACATAPRRPAKSGARSSACA